MENTVYIRLRHKVFARPNDTVKIGDIALLICEDSIYKEIMSLTIHHVDKKDKNIVIIDGLSVIKKITKHLKNYEIQTIGPSQTIVEIVYPQKSYSKFFFVLVWLLLFFGSGLAIMNFHEDVSMQEVHQKIYKIITGKDVAKPLLLQIPYSFGLGLGMILFFNHLFRKRINEEPSPLEIEMFKYQQDLDSYVAMHENKESMKTINDH